MQNQHSSLPSLISHNARTLHSHSMNMLEKINWLNKEYNNRTVRVHTSVDITVLNRVSVKDTAIASKVRFLKFTLMFFHNFYLEV